MLYSRRRIARTYIGLSLAFLQVLSASAGTITFTEDGLNARSSLRFRGSANVRTTVPKGTEGDVLERFKLPSGNYGIKLKVTKLGDDSTSLNIGEEIWVYYHQDADLRHVALYDDNGNETANAEDGTWAVALDSFRVAKPEKKKKIAICESCHKNGVALNAAAPILEKQTTDLANVIEIVKSDAEKKNDENPAISDLDPSVEEIVAYMKMRQAHQGIRNGEASARKVAKLLVQECEAQDVPLDLAVSIIGAETGEEYLANTRTSTKGANGPLQLWPPTFAGLKYGISEASYHKLPNASKMRYAAESKELTTNVHYGVMYLHELLVRFHGKYAPVIAAYNGGPKQGKRINRGEKASNRETRNYIIAVQKHLRTYRAYTAAVNSSKTKFASTN